MCVQGSKRRRGGDRKRWRGEWGGNGSIAGNGSVMSSEEVEEYGENVQKGRMEWDDRGGFGRICNVYLMLGKGMKDGWVIKGLEWREM